MSCGKGGENPIREEDEGCVVVVRSETFRPRSYDRSSSDGRVLGMMVDRMQIHQDTP
jgi:hypothetical protein